MGNYHYGIMYFYQRPLIFFLGDNIQLYIQLNFVPFVLKNNVLFSKENESGCMLLCLLINVSYLEYVQIFKFSVASYESMNRKEGSTSINFLKWIIKYSHNVVKFLLLFYQRILFNLIFLLLSLLLLLVLLLCC